MATKVRTLFDADESYTDEEAAEILKVSKRQIHRWISERRFPEGGVINLPRGWRIWGWAANQFLDERTI